MAYQSEAALEQQFIEQLNKQGYTSVSIPNYDALVENFKIQFAAFNAAKLDHPLTSKEWERVFNIMLGKSVFQSAKILRDKFVLEREDGTKVYLSFFDADHTKNIFQVTNQTTVVGKYVNRYDVTILVNGLPLIQVELKRRGIDIREAVNQVMRYKKHSYNGLYHFIQLFVVSNGVDTKYFANSDRDMLHSLAFFWTDFNNVRITNLKEFSISFLARDHIIKMLTRYTILNDTDKLLMVMRPYQVYAVEALVRQATLTNRNAYVWHTTGAGKTLTSFKTAQILAANPNIKKVIFLVDRKDLDSQTTEEFNKFEAGSVDATDKTDVLVKQMQDKNRQLIVTTMQKMANAVKRPQYAKVMDAYKDEKVVFIIDECHRSQFGDMHKDIVRHFQKAQFFGFTGTPRFEVNGKTEGKITQRIYDKKKGESYLHIGPPKTKTSARTIPVPSLLMNIIKKFYTENPNHYFLTGKTKPTEPRTYRQFFSRFLKRNGLQKVKFHEIRHTFAVRAIEIPEFDIKSLSEILGHKNVSFTLNVYGSANLQQKVKCMNLLNDLL